MADSTLTDYYEILQVSPRADNETIERVFRHLARRYHPDNRESGDAAKFSQLVEAHTVLSSAEKRANYDVNHERVREARWRLFDHKSTTNDIVTDSRIRLGMLSILYAARRNSPDDPGVGVMEIERLLDVPETALRFQTWYLRENGWVERLAAGTLAITASGVDKVLQTETSKPEPHRLTPGEQPAV